MAQHFSPIIRDQRTLIEGIKKRLRDPGQERWEDGEAYRALNDSVAMWAGRVSSPYIYTITGGLLPNVQEYTIPDYVTGPLEVQRKSHRYWAQYEVLLADADYVWATLNGWELERASDGDGQTLRIPVTTSVFSRTTEEARVIWQAENGLVPDEIMVLDDAIGASAATLDIADMPEVSKFGYLKIDNELIQYSDYTIDSAGLATLTGLVRGVSNTTAAAHSADAEVYFCIAAPDASLFQQLQFQMMASLNSLYITESSATETQHYQWAMRWYQQKADEFWEGFIPLMETKMVLTRQALGGWIQ